MDRLEFELRRQFEVRPAPEAFAARTMERVRRAELAPPAAAGGRWRWALAGALAASLVGGVVVHEQRAERRAAERAEAQLVEALLLAGSKIHLAREAVWGRSPGGD